MNLDVKMIVRSFFLATLSLLLVAGVLYAATTIGSNINTDGTLLINNATSTVTNLTMINATTTSATTTAFYVSGLATLTTASSTDLVKVHQLKVASTGSTIGGAVFGSCNLGAVAISAASSTYADCTSATGIVAADRVFVQATSSMPVGMVVVAASSTAADTINVRLYDTKGVQTDIASGNVWLNFWALR